MSVRIRNCVRDLWDGKDAVIDTAYINCETAGFARGGELTKKGMLAAFKWFGPRIVDGDASRQSTVSGRQVGSTVSALPSADIIRFPIVPRLRVVRPKI